MTQYVKLEEPVGEAEGEGRMKVVVAIEGLEWSDRGEGEGSVDRWLKGAVEER